MIIVPSGNQGRPIKGVAHCGCALCLIERLHYVALRARFPGPRALVLYTALVQLTACALALLAELGLRLGFVLALSFSSRLLL